jgi:small subunit ribosomal protein S16
MAVKIGLNRVGKKKNPSYRLVVKNPQKGKIIEDLGFYNPRTKARNFNEQAIVRRLQQGAQLMDAVRKLLEKDNIIEAGEKNRKKTSLSIVN